jgi:threonine/homoserine/homoserine lactone efflux protein
METALAVASILGAIAIGAASPGPSFVLVARIAVATSRRDGLMAALGMGVGGVIFGGLALIGLRALLTEVTWLYLTLKVAGGLYLVYLGFRLWRGARAPIGVNARDAQPTGSLRRSFILALATQLSNPKAAVVYGSIFAALLPQAPSGWLFVFLPIGIFAIEAGWYTLVACVFSAPRPRAAYLRSKTLIDRIAGSVMAALGLRLILSGMRPG